jgi:hypothetical protein
MSSQDLAAFLESGGVIQVCRPWNKPYKYRRQTSIRRRVLGCVTNPHTCGPKTWPENPLVTMGRHVGAYNGQKYTVSKELS